MRQHILWATLVTMLLTATVFGQSGSGRGVAGPGTPPGGASASGEPAAATASQAAAATMEKLSRKGEIDGQNWSITASLEGKPLAEVLQWLSDTARRKPWELAVVIDYQGLAASIGDLSKKTLTVNLPGVSLREVLDVVLAPGAAFAVQDDGTVLISAVGTLEAIAGTWPLGSDLPTKAAADVRRTLARGGTVNGVRWSVDVEFVGLPRADVLQKIADLAAKKPHQVKMLISMPLIRERFGPVIDQLITVRGADISLHQALSLVLGSDLGYVIQNDGTVLVAPRASLASRQRLSMRVVFPDRNWISFLSRNPGNASDPLWDRPPELADVSAAFARACHQELGIPEDSPLVNQFCQINTPMLNSEGRSTEMEIYIGGRNWQFVEVRPVADRVAERMVADVKAQVAASVERLLAEGHRRRADLEAQVAELTAKSDQLAEPRATLEVELNGPGFALFRANMEYALACERDRQTRAMDLEAQKARQKALAERIALIRTDVRSGLTKDAISSELERIVKVREEQLAAATQLEQAGRTQHEAVLEAEIRLAEARTGLAERRETVSRAVGGDLLAKLNADLVAVSVDLAESEARLAGLTRLLEEYQRYCDLRRRSDALQTEMSRLKQDIAALNRRLSPIVQALTDAQPPKVDVQMR